MRILAAMQTVSADQLATSDCQSTFNTADAELLKLTLIVIGLNKDAQHHLYPGTIVRALGQHDDPIVRQYVVWAVIENRWLDLNHLGIPFDRVEAQPENVQAKLLELGVSSIPDLIERQEFIISGSNLPSVLAREGLGVALLRRGDRRASTIWPDIAM